MASVSPSSIRKHPAERAMEQGFGSYVPDFFTMRIILNDTPNLFGFDSRPAGSPRIRRPKRKFEQPTKLLPGAKRFVEKLGRQARLRMQRGW